MQFVSSISKLANQTHPSALDPRFMEWYISLKRIQRLPEKIPPLPNNIIEKLNQPCPKEICNQKKSENSSYTVGEKCTLMLVPKELGTINELESVVNSYGEKHFPENEPEKQNPLQFRCFWDRAHKKHGKTQPEATHWVLHTDDILENSRYSSYQERLVDFLAKKTSMNWEIPTLRDTTATIFLKKIATGKSLYQLANEQNQNISTYTLVKEKVEDLGVTVGGFSSQGLAVLDADNFGPYDFSRIGIAADLTFY